MLAIVIIYSINHSSVTGISELSVKLRNMDNTRNVNDGNFLKRDKVGVKYRYEFEAIGKAI